MIVDPAVNEPEIPYTPFVTFTLHCVVEVGNVGPVAMQAPLTFAPVESRTVPVIVSGAFVAVGTGVVVGLVDGGSVRSGVEVGVAVRGAVGGVAAGGSWTAGEPEAVRDGDGDGDGELAAEGDGDADALGTGAGVDVSICGRLPSSSTTADADAARALAAASGWPAASWRAASSVRDCTRSRR